MSVKIESYINQGELNHSSAYKKQVTYGLHEIIVFILEGVGATLFCCSMLVEYQFGMLSGLVIALSGVILLFLHLGHPLKVWRVLARLGKSWISRGTVFIATFFVIGLVYLILAEVNNLEKFRTIDLTLQTIILLVSFLILIYPGFILAQSSSIPFWHSGFVPVSFAFSSATTGIMWFLVYLSYDNCFHEPCFNATFNPGDLIWLQVVLLLFLFISVLTHLLVKRNSGSAARESANNILRGTNIIWFIVVGCLIGVIFPIISLIFNEQLTFTLWLTVAIAKTVGDISLRYSIIKVGMYDPIYGD
jgi:formate-dependent nitrite reductase membrane component NrfD